MKKASVEELRKNLRDFIDLAREENQVVYITTHGKPTAALVSIKYAKLIQQLMESKE